MATSLEKSKKILSDEQVLTLKFWLRSVH